jgi:hypothetical protein
VFFLLVSREKEKKSFKYQSNMMMTVLIICGHITTIRSTWKRSSETSTIIRRRFIWVFGIGFIDMTDAADIVIIGDVRGSTAKHPAGSICIVLAARHAAVGGFVEIPGSWLVGAGL